MLFESGDRVRHAKWGSGTVVKRLAHKAARVAFDDVPKLPRTIKLSDLQRDPRSHSEVEPTPAAADAGRPSNSHMKSLGEGSASRSSSIDVAAQPSAVEHGTAANSAFFASKVHGARAEVRDLAGFEAWQTLEALRLGVVPAAGVQRYTVGRERELAAVAGLLQQSRGCRVLWGDYGTGKTHLLETAQRLALEKGYAAARVTLDPREHALSNPLRLYREIVQSARYGNQLRPAIDWLFETLAEAGNPTYTWSNGSNASRFFSPYLLALREERHDQIPILRDYVSGQSVDGATAKDAATAVGWKGPPPLVMSDYRTYGRMYIHLIGQLSRWFADAGARGLVVLFDEVERVDALRYEDQFYALEVLKHYAAVTMHPRDLAFDPERLYKGGFQVHRDLPLRVDAEQPLIAVFALTPLEEIQERFAEVTKTKAYDIELGPLYESLLPQLVARIAEIYSIAYPSYSMSDRTRLDIARELRDAFDGGHDSFRSAVRGSVLLFDADRLDWPARRSG